MSLAVCEMEAVWWEALGGVCVAFGLLYVVKCV